jgi:hypothetical protein
MRGTAPRYDFVQDDRSSKASLVFACSIPDSVATPGAAAALPAFLKGAFRNLRSGDPNKQGYAPFVHVHNETEYTVRFGDATILYLGFAVGDDHDDVRRTVSAVLERAESLKKGEFTPSDVRKIARDMQAWLITGLDSTETQLDRLYELGPEGLALYSVLHLTLEFRDIQSAVQHCFAPASLHVVGYGRVRDAAAALKDGGYGPIEVSTVGDGSPK